MQRLKKILLWITIVLAIVVGTFLVVVGPWPVYSDSGYKSTDYYAQAIKDIDAQVKESDLTDTPGALQAGWAMRDITPPVGVPMAGYSGRGEGKKSKGVRDPLETTALALSDGKDTVIIIGSDMLIIPPNISDMVRAAVTKATDGKISQNDILFNASHTHCGPGGWGPGLMPEFSAGKYDDTMPSFIADRFADAALAALADLKPASLATGQIELPEFIRNRSREAIVDPVFNYMVAKHDDGKMVYLMRYSAHPTTFGSDMMLFSAEYPGELKRFVREQTHQDAQYLGGAVGSMGPRAPEGPSEDARVAAMGQAIGQRLIDVAKPENLQFRDHLDIASVGVSLGMPPLQIRPVSAAWRVSPFIAKAAGVPQQGWIHGIRIGDVVLMGMPCDFSGEISVEWRKWATERHLELWTLSFCSTYCGYFSPDKYYNVEPLGYETNAMSWFGPNIEAYFTDLYHHIVGQLVPSAKA